MKRGFTIAVCLMMTMSALAQIAGFDKNWKFWSDKNTTKQTVSIPHDAMQTEERSDTLADGRHNGFFSGGIYHYEKIINVPTEWLQRHVTLNFEGVYQKSAVLINGKKAGGMIYGYTPFTVCADGLLHEGENTIRVDVDNLNAANSRWYSGAGIYRPVHLCVQEQIYIEDVRISTHSISPAIVNVTTKTNGGKIKTTILWKGETVDSAEGTNVNITVPHAKLWSAEEPNLYQAKVELIKDGKVIETRTKNFGIRQITWSANGLLVNGKQTLLKGGCLHHDNGILGACEYDDAAYRKIAIMKSYGFNAIRSSHNPCSEAMLKTCDELGMYVMDELWDMWYLKKTPYDYAAYWEANHEKDIEAMVRKDFSHPSVIMYSIGNEVKEPADVKGIETAQRLIDKLHLLDPSRPVTAGINLTLMFMHKMGISWSQFSNSGKNEEMSSEQYNKMVTMLGDRMMKAVLRPDVDSITSPVLDMLDISGYNYGSYRYEADGTEHPGRVVVGAETYPYQLSQNWAQVERQPYLVGDFMWTAWDYIGEVSLGAWYNSDENPDFTQKYPCLLAGAGAIDLIGNPTGEVLRAKAIWSKDDKPYLAVRPVSRKPLIKAAWRGTNSIPSWSWKGMEGVETQVEVFTTAPQAKLYLNNRLIGEKPVDNNVATFDVAYEPGTLKAVTIDSSGNEHEAILTSANGKTRITANTEKATYHTGDLIYLNIDLTDANGIVESNADTQLSVKVDGAELLGFGSANPRTTERFNTGRYTTYYGRAQAVLRAETSGSISLSISGKGIKPLHKIICVQ